MFQGKVVRNGNQQPVLLQHHLRIGGGSRSASRRFQGIHRALAVDVFALQTQRAASTRILRHHHYAVADLHSTWLRDRENFARRLVSKVLRLPS
jgi:hypothetical protein